MMKLTKGHSEAASAAIFHIITKITSTVVIILLFVTVYAAVAISGAFPVNSPPGAGNDRSSDWMVASIDEPGQTKTPGATATADLNPDSFIPTYMAQYHVPGVAACMVKNGEVLWSGCYGWANIERNIEVSDSTAFMLASISKTLTGVALMQLWESGEYELDEPVDDYLFYSVTNPNHPGVDITFRQVLTHTSSIKDNWSVMYSVYYYGDCPIPLGDYVYEYLNPGGIYYSATSNFYTWAPENGWSYCNEAFALAGHLVETISGMAFDQYSRDSIFSPLGMNHTSWFLSRMDTTYVAVPYIYDGSSYVPQGYYGYADYPAGQLRSTALDLGRHLLMFLQDGQHDGVRILDSATVAEMTTIQFPTLRSTMGLVWFRGQYDGSITWEHGGGDAGVSTLVSWCPERDAGVVVLTNGGSAGATRTILNRLYGALQDVDEDGVLNSIDNCPETFNPDQEDFDGDEFGDLCDNCMAVYNPDQEDSDSDGIGDSCEVIRTWYVRVDGGGDVGTIQTAIDSASNRDTVLVADGVYSGEGNCDIDLGGRRIVIASEHGPAHTIIDCGGSAGQPARGFAIENVSDTSCVIEGFTIRNGYGPVHDGGSSGGAILCVNSAPMIKNCVLTGNEAMVGGAVAAFQSVPRLVNCTIVNNSADFGAGVFLFGGLPLSMENCIVAFNDGDMPVNCLETSSVTLSCCDIYGNSGGDWLGCLAAWPGIGGNISADPLFYNAEIGDYGLQSASPCNPVNNNCSVLIGACDVGSMCDCFGQCDLNLDGLLNAVDVVIAVNLVYKQLDSRQQLQTICPADNGDWDFDGSVNPVDIVWYVNYVYRTQGNGPEDPCGLY